MCTCQERDKVGHGGGGCIGSSYRAGDQGEGGLCSSDILRWGCKYLLMV